MGYKFKYPEEMRNRQNPFLFPHWGEYSIGFQTFRDKCADPLWWVEGGGFKDTAVVKAIPRYFPSKEEAEKFLKEEVLPFIKKYRADQADLVKGW